MAADGVFFAPVGYSIWWPLTGAALVLMCLGWIVWVWVSTSERATTGVPAFVAPRNPGSVRNKFLQLITDVENKYDAGTIDERAAHLELSLAVRGFVHEMTGLPAQRMTLTQLRGEQLALAADAVELFYPGEFAAHGGGLTVAESTGTARNVVASWH